MNSWSVSGQLDGDATSDLSEFRAGTNPSRDASVLRVITLTTFGNNPAAGQRTTTVIWAAIPGRAYRVQFKNGVNEAWTDLPGEVLATGTSSMRTHVTEISMRQRFYRVVPVP